MPTEQEILEEKMRKLGPLELIAYLEKELKITQEGYKNARCKGCARHFFSKKIKTIEQSNIYGFNIVETMKCDGGWRLPECYSISEVFMFHPKFPDISIFDLTGASEEASKYFKEKQIKYIREYYYNGKLLCSHLGVSNKISVEAANLWINSVISRIDVT